MGKYNVSELEQMHNIIMKQMEQLRADEMNVANFEDAFSASRRLRALSKANRELATRVRQYCRAVSTNAAAK